MYDSSVEGEKPEAGAPDFDLRVEHLAEVLHDKMEHLDPTNDGTWAGLSGEQKEFYRQCVKRLLIEMAFYSGSGGS